MGFLRNTMSDIITMPDIVLAESDCLHLLENLRFDKISDQTKFKKKALFKEKL